MIIDKENLFSDAQGITTAEGSTNTIDTGVVGGRALGVGEPLYLVTIVDVALTGASVTCVVALEGDSTTTFSPDGTENMFTIPALAAAGTKYIARLRPGSAPLAYRYLRVKYTPTGGGDTLSTGSFTTFLAHNIDAYTAYADNVTITA